MENLPVELLAQTFGATFDPIDCFADDCTEIQHADQRCRLSLVCRDWKELVLSTPELWTYICVADESTPEGTRQQLGRAKNRPLHITIAFSDEVLSEKAAEFYEEVEAVTEKASQWASFLLRGGDLFEDDLEKLIPNNLPILSDAAILGYIQVKDFTPFHSAPNLRRLSISGDFYKPFMFADSSPSLTYLKITSFHDGSWQRRPNELFGHLASFIPLLETMEIDASDSTGPREDDSFDRSPTPLWPVLPHLKKLSIRGCYRNILSHVLTHINAPKLDELHLTYIGIARNIETPIALPPCRKVSFTDAQLSAIYAFMSKVTNAAVVSIQVDFISAFTLSFKSPNSLGAGVYGLEGCGNGPTEMIVPMVQLVAMTNVDWIFPPWTKMKGLIAHWQAVHDWSQRVLEMVTQCSASNRSLTRSESEIVQKFEELISALQNWSESRDKVTLPAPGGVLSEEDDVLWSTVAASLYLFQYG